MTVTAEEVQSAVTSAGIRQIEHHDCGACGSMTHYLIGWRSGVLLSRLQLRLLDAARTALVG